MYDADGLESGGVDEESAGALHRNHSGGVGQLIVDTVDVLKRNRIVLDGGREIIKRIDTEGYEFIKSELGIEIEKEDNRPASNSIGVCAVKEAVK